MLAILVVMLVVVSVWGIVFFRQVGLLGGCLAVLLIGSCFGHAFFHTAVGPFPVTADRFLLGILLAAYLLYRYWGRVDAKPVDTIDLLLIAFITAIVFSTLTHDWRADGARPMASMIFFYLMPLAIYLVAREAPLSGRAVLGLFAALAAFGLYLAATSVLEQQQMWALVFPKYIASDTHAEFLGRGRGPFLNPVGNGMFLCVGMFSLLMFWPRTHRIGKAVLLLLTLVFLAGIYCTLTRCVWLAAGAGLMIMVVSRLPRRGTIALVVAVALSGVLMVAARWDTLNSFKRDRDVSAAEMSQSASLRPILAYIAWQMFLDRPLTGCGYRHYEPSSDLYLADRSTPLKLERGRRYVQHNVFLSLLAETGMIGAGLFVLLLAALCRASWRLLRARHVPLAYRQQGLLMFVMLTSYLAMAMFHDLALIPMVHMLIFLLAGITRGLLPAIGLADTDAEQARMRYVVPVDQCACPSASVSC